MSFRRLSFALLFCIALIAPASWSQTLIRVYVQAGSGDFAANGAGDSSLDLRKALLGKSRTLVVVDSPAEADVVARIDSRNVRKETAAVNTYANQSKDGRSTTATTVPSVRNVNELHVTLLAGNSEIPLHTESALSWRLAASDMASSIDHWTKENYAKLVERRLRQEPAAPAAPAAAAQVPVATQEASIAPGMTEADVTKAMGAPEKKVSFGTKAQWSYRGMQVVFEDGKVTDVKF
ncbi:hypothetical protein [Terriglobus sp. RCC_193]|uniref:hypothetical protein n=1 Tax=Terriglobus sp. RCC_193 TaxID=3239218 RepID=UPI003524E7C5